MGRMELSVVNDAGESRFELLDDGGNRIGLIDYELSGGTINLIHTEVDPMYEGRGYGSVLVREALAQIRDMGGLRMIPSCPFVARYVRRHPDENPRAMSA